MKLDEADLKKATNNFDQSKRVGVGGFGEVFKGFFRSTYVAIKLINTVRFYLQQFWFDLYRQILLAGRH